MVRFDDVPQIANRGWLGSLGTTTAQRLAMQQEIADASAPLVRGRILHLPLALPARPEACHEVLVTKARSFEKSPGLRVLLHDLGGQGLFTSEGEHWRRQRKLMAPIFTPHALTEFPEMIRLATVRAADQIQPDQAIDLAHETTRIAMTVVGNALFGTDTFDEVDALGEALTTALGWVNRSVTAPGIGAHILAMDAAGDLAARTGGRLRQMFEGVRDRFETPFLVGGSRGPELQDAIAVVDARIQELVDERRREGLGRPDLLSRLLAAQDAETGAMTDRQVRDEVVTLFVAGHETTATSLAWCFYLLARHPKLRERVVAEADAFGDGPDGPDRPIVGYDPERLELTTRVFREALRLYPPVTLLPRRSVEDVEIAGTLIPRRTVTFVSTWAQHRRADVWTEPERFDPDRFLPEAEAARPKGSYLPFGLGPRVCIGMHFAMIEGPIVLATLLRRFEFEIDGEREIVEDEFATLRPRGGVPAVVRSRDPTIAPQFGSASRASERRIRNVASFAIIGLTGGIASGKSTVSRMCRELGVPVVDADAIARFVVQPGQPAAAEIRAKFGAGVFAPDGGLDREALGALVFADPSARAQLNAITHPRIAMEMKARSDALREAGHPWILYDAALLVENRAQDWLDGLIVVSVPREVQLERLMARDGGDEARAAARIDSQLPLADKIAVADWVIDNSLGLVETEAQVREVVERIGQRVAGE